MLRANLVTLCLLAFGPVTLAGQHAGGKSCGAPIYKIAVADAQNPAMEALGISIKPKDVTIRNLFAIACQLRTDYPTQTVVAADIFNDAKAAKYTPVYGVEYSKNSNETAYLGTYYLDRQKGIETLTLAVDQQDPCGHNIKVDLRANTVSIVTCK